MAGITLGIGETNPKRGAVQFDARRIDGVKFVVPTAAGITSVPIGSIVSLQEDSAGKQIIVPGIAAYTDASSNAYAVIAVGILEAASQADYNINQTVGEYVDGDFVSMISDLNAVASVPYDTSHKPTAGFGAYVTPAGKLSSASGSGNVTFIGSVWSGTPGVQNTGQLKTGYVFARLATVTIGLV